jgi:hypothetical protein
VGGYVLDSSASANGPVAVSCECGMPMRFSRTLRNSLSYWNIYGELFIILDPTWNLSRQRSTEEYFHILNIEILATMPH